MKNFLKLHGLIRPYDDRGKTLDWMFTDSKEFFDERLNENPNDKNLLWYKDNPIKYQINKDGFRLPYELTKEEGNVYLGCSFTFGVGLHYDKTWAHLLHEKIGEGKYWNLGAGGAGFQTVFRILYNNYSRIKIKNVFLHLPFPLRYEAFDEASKTWYPITPISKSKWGHPIRHRADNLLDFSNSESWSKTYMNELNNFNYVQTNLLAISYLCDKVNAPLYYVGEFERDYKLDENYPTKARDLHPTPTYHKKLSEHFLNLYNSKAHFKLEKNLL